LIRCVCGKKIGPDPRNFNQRVSLGRNDLLIRTFPKTVNSYRYRMFSKLNIHGDVELTHLAIRHGLCNAESLASQ
ncbi:LuxR C-terminal-related transcriptional regulator, partial [Klebsiella pneumoniae]